MKHRICSLIFIAALTTPGCSVYMLSVMADLCNRNGGVDESEVAGGYIRVKCKDGTIKTRSRQ